MARESRRPLLCLVADRRRLCDRCEAGRTRACLLAQVGEAVAAGIDLVQIRERDIDDRALASIVRDAVDLARASATRIIVNDRIDIALAAGAGGVHLRGDSIPPAAG